MMLSVVLGNYKSFGTNAKFSSANEDVVLALREAQVYGASTKGYTGVCGGMTPFDCRYGVHFTSASPNNNGFILFVDVNNNRIYDGGDTVISPQANGLSVVWGSNISITELSCGVGIRCTNGDVSITFKRPNVDAYIADLANSSSYDISSIQLTDSNTSAIATVTISSAGQISLN